MANPIYGSVSRASAPAMWMVIFCIACTAALMVGAADPDPLQDFCVADLSTTATKMNGYPCRDRATVTAKDFLYTAFRKAGNTSLTHLDAMATFATITQFPGVNTLGISHARLDFAKGGVIPPHTHPLATETLFVVEGTVYTGFVSSDNVLYASTLQKGDLTIYPRATLHFQINVGNGPAVTFNSFNAQNPGFLTSSVQLFVTNIPNAVLEKSMGINATTIKEIQASILATYLPH